MAALSPGAIGDGLVFGGSPQRVGTQLAMLGAPRIGPRIGDGTIGDPATLIDLEDVFAARWPRWRDRLGERLQGGDLPVELGLPILIERYPELGSRLHREIGRADAAELQIPSNGTAQGYCMGYLLRLKGLRGARPPIQLHPGTAGAEAEDAEGRRWPVEVVAEYHGQELSGAEFFARFPEPPLLVTATQFPDPASVTLYEVLPYLGAELPRFVEDYRSHDGDSRRMAEQQAPFLAWVLGLFGDGAQTRCVDVGCGTGWLSGSLALAGADDTLGFDLRRGSLAGFVTTFPEAERSMLAVGDMFDWPLGPESVDLVCLRNNSAFAFAREFGAEFVALFEAMGRSLRPGGGIYLSFVGNGAGRRTGSGLQNPSLVALTRATRSTGLEVVKLMRVAEFSGALLCRAGEPPAHLAAQVNAQRNRVHAQISGTRKAETELAQAWALCLLDIAGEIILRMLETGAGALRWQGPSWIRWQLDLVLRNHYPEFLELRQAAAPDAAPLLVDLQVGPGSAPEPGVLRPLGGDEATAAGDGAYHLVSADHDAQALDWVLPRLPPTLGRHFATRRAPPLAYRLASLLSRLRGRD